MTAALLAIGHAASTFCARPVDTEISEDTTCGLNGLRQYAAPDDMRSPACVRNVMDELPEVLLAELIVVLCEQDEVMPCLIDGEVTPDNVADTIRRAHKTLRAVANHLFSPVSQSDVSMRVQMYELLEHISLVTGEK